LSPDVPSLPGWDNKPHRVPVHENILLDYNPVRAVWNLRSRKDPMAFAWSQILSSSFAGVGYS
jgi:hypothetical protein